MSFRPTARIGGSSRVVRPLGVAHLAVESRSVIRARVGWVIAVVGPLAVTAIARAADDPGNYRPGAWYLLPVVGAALLAGRRALVCATVIAVGGFWWSVIARPGAHIEGGEVAGLVGFGVIALLLGFLVDRLDHLARAERAAVTITGLADALEQAQRIAHIGSWEWELASNHTRRSRQMSVILGLGADHPDEEPFDVVLERVHPDDRQAMLDRLSESVATGESFEVEARIVRPDGSVRHLVVRAEPMSDSEGKLVGLRGVAQDVTERREAEEALETARRELFESELRQIRDRRRVEALQEAVLPSELPSVSWLELDANYTPATPDLAVGGDWYDTFVVDACTVAFAVGDVSGHGVEAAALMAQLRNAARAYAAEDPAPGTVVTRLNRFLCALDVDSFATAIYGVAAPDRVLLAGAGHPDPVRFGVSAPALVGLPGDPLLGVNDRHEYREATVGLVPGEGLLLYTDGLVERRGEHIDWGFERLLGAVATCSEQPTTGLCDDIVGRMVDVTAGRDDVCQVLLRVPPRTTPLDENRSVP